MDNRHHHGCGCRVTDPHGQEGRHTHETQHQTVSKYQKNIYVSDLGLEDSVLTVLQSRQQIKIITYVYNSNRKLNMVFLSMSDVLFLFCKGIIVSNSQSWSHTNYKQHPQGDALVQIPVFHSNRNQQSPHKQHVCVLQVLHTHLRRQGHSQSKMCVCLCVCEQIFILAKQIVHAAAVTLLTFLDSMTPNKGKRRAGSRAVTPSGRTSVHQYTAIRTIT